MLTGLLRGLHRRRVTLPSRSHLFRVAVATLPRVPLPRRARTRGATLNRASRDLLRSTGTLREFRVRFKVGLLNPGGNLPVATRLEHPFHAQSTACR